MSQNGGTNPKVYTYQDGIDHSLGATPMINGLPIPCSAAFTISQGSANIALVNIALQDNAGNTIARPQNFNLWLSDSPVGLGLTAVTASGGITVNGSNGAVLGIITASKALQAQTKADGTFKLQITDTAKTGFYVAVQNEIGLFIVSRQLVTGDYG